LASTHRQRLRAGIESTFAKPLSPERTRRATWFERLTAFFVLHSVIGFLRWRLQRELWRRDVVRLEGGPALRPDR
jgi:hypothetical protein